MMNLLRTIDLDSLPPDKLKTLTLRQAARAVVLDEEKNVALLHVSKGGYYKLPGGGVEPGENIATALKRECLEEIGCHVEIDQELGMTIEYRGKYNIKQESFCFLAHLVGPKGLPNLTEEEIADGFSSWWGPLDQAITLMEEANTEDYQGKFIIPRELVFLHEAKKLLFHK
jgi:8-oxo-dGTP pyrophosphatase MutT (NUDIX family)